MEIRSIDTDRAQHDREISGSASQQEALRGQEQKHYQKTTDYISRMIALLNKENDNIVSLLRKPSGTAVVTPSYGNLRGRILGESQRLLSELLRFRAYENELWKKKATNQDINEANLEEGGVFLAEFLPNIKKLQAECALVHVQEPRLDQAIASIDSMREMNDALRRMGNNHPPYYVNLDTMEEIAQALTALANDLKP